MFKSKIIVLFALICALTFAVNAQKNKRKVVTASASGAVSVNLPVRFENFKLNSKLMNREMPYRIVFPANYDLSKDKRYAVIYLLHGYSGHFDNWVDKTKLTDYAKDYDYIIVTPEGDNGWYADSVSLPNDRYETYIADELINEVDKKFRTIADKEHRAIAGLSMGGYGALKFGIKYPDKFILAGSFSGAVGIGSYKVKEDLPQGLFRDSIIKIFGEPESESKNSNDIFKMIGEMPKDKIPALPFLYLDCGTEDELGFLPTNRQLADILTTKKIPHEFRELPGGHNWKLWNTQVDEFLRLSKKFVGVSGQR
jgi:putative tributyrin esterase